jgi:type IV pilus assembly protein PilF
MSRRALRVVVPVVWSLILLAGCAGRPAAPSHEFEQSASQQSSSSDTRQRAKVHTELGSLYLSDGRLAVALEEARTAIAADADYAPAYNLLGLVHMTLKENQLAEENFERALRLIPNDAEINNNYGWFLCQTGREKRSLAYFQAALKNPLYATPAKPYTNAGLCSLRIKDDAAAEEYLSRALRIDAVNGAANYWLADIFYRHGRLGEARLRLDELHRGGDANAESLWLAVRVDHKLGDRDAEARHSSQLRRKFAGTPEYQKLMQGQYE